MRNPEQHTDEELLLESAVWTAELGAYEWDMRSDRVRWLNRWCEHVGIDPCDGERHGERWREMMHPEDRVRARRDFDAHLAGRLERYETEYRIRTMSGDWRWIRSRAYFIRSSPDGVAERMVGACVDVDERKRAELALSLTQRKLEALAAAAPIWMVLTDAAGSIEFVNRPMNCITSGPLVGRNVASLFSEPSEAARVDDFRRALANGNTAQMHTMVLEDGRAFATWAQPILESDRVVGIASVTADVSERQDHERELLMAINREQRRFGSDLHDGLGQELTGIALLVKSLSNRAAREAPAMVARLDEVLNHVNVAISTTRTVARGMSPVANEHGGLAHALHDLARRWRETQQANVQCRVRGAHDSAIEPMLADHIYRIAQEALTNAVKHSGASRINLMLRQSVGRIGLVVTDNGCGIEAKSVNNGLGFNIMRRRAELVGAQLKIVARIGGGTRVECIFGPLPIRPKHR